MKTPDTARIAEIEALMAVSLPEPVRALYRESDGYFADEGQWFVVWPLGELLARNQDAWSRGLPRNLLAFGDDGTGNPFCVDLHDPTDAVVRWNWIDLAIEQQEGTIAEFRQKWLS